MMSSRGLQCLKLNRNQTENDRYWQKITLYFFGKCLKMEIFLHSQSNLAKNEYDPKKYFLQKINVTWKTIKYYQYNFITYSLHITL
jgi:hypothetical protein